MDEGVTCLAVIVAVLAFPCLLAISIPTATAGGALMGVGLYLVVLYQTLVGRPLLPRHTPSSSPQPGEQPAYWQYFFGQASSDLRAVVSATYARCVGSASRRNEQIRGGFFHGQSWIVMPIGVVLLISLWFGAAASMLTATIAVALHAALVGMAYAMASAATGALRLIDTAMLRLRGVTITCGSCHHRVSYPVYACPGPGCTLRHTDVRPGRYGMFRRICACGTRLPTLLVLGSYRLEGFCPFCDRPLADRSGSAPEIVVPFLGPTASGKTRLMLTLVSALEELCSAGGAAIDFASTDTRARLRDLKPVIARGLRTPPTRTDLPRAYSLFVKPRRGARRFVHLFDVAGERLNRQDDAHELRYLGLARCFVFVLDPLSVEAFWRETPEVDQQRLESFRSPQPPQDLFLDVIQRVQALGANVSRARLAVAVSKNDLIAHLPPLAGVAAGSDAIEDWLDARLGLGNLVRALRHEFGEVRFFFTAAVVDERGAVDASVEALARWLLGGEGLVLKGRRRDE